MYKVLLEEKGAVPSVRICDDVEITDDLELIKLTRGVRHTIFVEILNIDWYSKITIIPVRNENHRA